MMLLTMMPVGANGDSAPACAPLPTISAIRNGEIAARAPTAIAIGARMAVVAMLPGPMLDSVTAIRKNMIGMTPALPRQALTARAAMRPSVPLLLAMPNSSVTPISVRNSCDRERADHRVRAACRRVHADDPRHRERDDADVDAASAC